MTRRDFTLRTEDSVALTASLWEAKNPKGVLLWLHGYAEHRLRYEHLGAWTAERGLSLVSIDFRGHGDSGGRRGYIKKFQDYFYDVDALLEYCRNELGEPEPVLGAHSNGALIAIRYHQEHPEIKFKTAVFSSPYLGLKMKVPAWKNALGKALGALYPRLSLSNDIPPEFIVKDPEALKIYKADRRQLPNVTAGYHRGAVLNQKLAQEGAPSFTLPLLLMLSKEDPFTDPDPMRSFYEHIGSGAKRLVEYENKHHEILQEPGREELYETIYDWIRGRL